MLGKTDSGKTSSGKTSSGTTSTGKSASENTDSVWMQEALSEAYKGWEKQEVPVGAVIVHNGEIIARAHNQPISGCNPVAHAEILVLQQAARALGNYRLVDCDLYVTLEPCTMCAGAIIHSRIRRVIFGACEPKSGAVVSVTQVLDQPQMNYRVEVTQGVLQDECSEMMSAFFRERRRQKKEERKRLRLC
ncbi:tRNA adenosine(34) deaminase TadA [Endozoicomonas gorgoniicola]|uniref:tRNA-specific adenosine deaminase n=1 Tax=Endozoicomonas gorgoniicola TaxID=1234144 RepID=A0ABT3MXA2_9GAMM|nr:tRNA adenosine(34) deaminase TadA [Endozoicomonas gorgoniicola]MCW7553996.1 tRNA adenosine(34) deaminase TadA [Endozoicomonas gorgoniicola]